MNLQTASSMNWKRYFNIFMRLNTFVGIQHFKQQHCKYNILWVPLGEKKIRGNCWLSPKLYIVVYDFDVKKSGRELFASKRELQTGLGVFDLDQINYIVTRLKVLRRVKLRDISTTPSLFVTPLGSCDTTRTSLWIQTNVDRVQICSDVRAYWVQILQLVHGFSTKTIRKFIFWKITFVRSILLKSYFK